MAALLLIRPGEGRRTALLFVQLFLASAIFILGRTVRDTLFLSRYPVDALPWMFVLYGVASAITVVVYGRFADRLARHKLIGGSAVIGIASYLAVWALVRAGVSLVYPVFYVWSEVFANLFIVQFWTLANDLHDARSAKRLFGTIGAARVLGVIAIGMTAGMLVRAIGTAQLLFVLVAMMAAAAWVAQQLRSEQGPGGDARRKPTRRGAKSIMSDRYVRVLALMILFGFTALTVGDYQFKVIARATYREDELAQFFSLFYAGTGIVSFVFQLFVTPRLLSRFGVGLGMTVMPTVFGASSAMLLGLPHLAIATAMKFADNGFQYTIHETTLQALYVPFEASTKARTRALLDAVIKPLSYGAGGLVLVAAAPRLAVEHLSIITCALVVMWIAVIPMVKRRYARSLQATLSVRGLLALDEPNIVLDADARRAVIQGLSQADERRVLAALEQLEDAKMPELVATLEQLTGHESADVRATALDMLADRGEGSPTLAQLRLSDPDKDVRAAAARCYAALTGDEAVEALEPMLADEARKPRVAALSAMLLHGGVEGGIRGGARLAKMLEGKAKERVEAARVLGRLGPSAYRPLQRLLHDAKPKVRRAALRACAGVADPRLIGELINMLADPACRARASTALVAVGEPAVEPLVALLRDPNVGRAVRIHVPRICQHLTTKQSYAALIGAIELDDSRVRLRVYSALARLREQLEIAAEPLERIEAWVRSEIADGCAALGAWQVLRQRYETPLFKEQAEYRYHRSSERVLRLLELRYERRSLRLARHRMADPRHRANALEVLDTSLEPSLRPLVMPWVDESLSIDERLQAAGDLATTPPPLDEVVQRVCHHANPYLVMLMLHAFWERRDEAGRAHAIEALHHPAPLVREAGIRLLAELSPDAGEQIRPLCDDEDAIVARHARAAIARLEDNSEQPEETVHSTVEKILLLRSAPMFEKVAGEDLVPLARVAEEVNAAAGETVFDEGDHGTDLYIIVSGRVAITHGGEQVATLEAGDAFGEMAVLDEAPRSASAKAMEDTELLRVGSEEFYEILHEQAEIAEGVIRMLTSRLREATAELVANVDPRAAATVPPMSRY